MESKSKFSERIHNFFKKNWLLLSILAIALISRLMYFNINSAIWYDEGEYFSKALSWASEVPFRLGPQRLPFFPFLASIFMQLGFNEVALRFTLVALPSIGVVFMTYLLGKEMYNKRVGLIASFLMSIFWVILFNVTRFHTDILAFFFWLLATYFFWTGYVKKKSKTSIILMGLFFGLGFVTRSATLQIIPILLAYLLITERFRFLKSKHLWLAAIIFVLTILPYFLWANAEYGQFNSFTYGYAEKAAEDVPFSWNYLEYIPWYLETIYLVIFLISLLTLYKPIFKYKSILKGTDEECKSDLFLVLSIIGILAFFIFILKPEKLGDARWMLYMSLALFLIIGKGFNYFYGFIKKHSKVLATFLVVALLFWGAYEEVTHADSVIQSKKDSFLQVKEAALWIKENSQPGDIVVSNSNTQMTYYAEREMITFGEEEKVMDKVKNNPRVKYFVLSAFEQHPDWAYQAPTNYQNLLKPAMAYFINEQNDQPILVVFEVVK